VAAAREQAHALAVAAADEAETVVLDLVGPPPPVGTVRLMVGRQGSMKLRAGARILAS
jgi:hypothetical protein